MYKKKTFMSMKTVNKNILFIKCYFSNKKNQISLRYRDKQKYN